MTTTTTTTRPWPSNPVRGPINAWFFRLLDGYVHSLLRPHKIQLFARHSATIAEIGPGTGANFRYYDPGTRVLAIEPNPAMHRHLRRTAERRRILLDLVPRGAEDTGLPAASVDTVVSTLVLCTVPDPEASLAEIRRILRPGGRLVFLEHVAAEPGTPLRRLQDTVHGIWHWFFEGCHTDRDTRESLEAAGFASVDAETVWMRSPFLPVNRLIVGTATA